MLLFLYATVGRTMQTTKHNRIYIHIYIYISIYIISICINTAFQITTCCLGYRVLLVVMKIDGKVMLIAWFMSIPLQIGFRVKG